MRCFVSINIPDKIGREIKKIQESLPEFRGKKTKNKNLHLTLKFLGEVDSKKIEKVKKRLIEVNFKEFETKIKSIGVFDNRKSKKYPRKIIVWLCLDNCEKLQKEIDEKLKGLFRKEKRFMSHLTIARVKKVDNLNQFVQDLKKIKIPKIRFNVNKFYLMKSKLLDDGPKYEIIEKFNLEKENIR